MSDYRLQIIHIKTGQVVHGWAPGDRVEIEMGEALCLRLKGEGVGWFKSEAKVLR